VDSENISKTIRVICIKYSNEKRTLNVSPPILFGSDERKSMQYKQERHF